MAVPEPCSYQMMNENLETYSLVWLDDTVKESKENIDVQQQLRSVINRLKIFERVDQCEQYIRSVSSQDRIVLIVSGRLGQEIVPRINDFRQISSIYIYCSDKKKHEQWATKYSKVFLSILLANKDEKVNIFFSVNHNEKGINIAMQKCFLEILF